MKKTVKTSIIIEVESNIEEVEVNILVEKALQDAGIKVINFDDYGE